MWQAFSFSIWKRLTASGKVPSPSIAKQKCYHQIWMINKFNYSAVGITLCWGFPSSPNIWSLYFYWFQGSRSDSSTKTAVLSQPFTKNHKCHTSWWLNQPLWKILYSQIGSFPHKSGWKCQKYLSCHHLAKVEYQTLPSTHAGRKQHILTESPTTGAPHRSRRRRKRWTLQAMEIQQTSLGLVVDHIDFLGGSDMPGGFRILCINNTSFFNVAKC